MKYNSSLKSVFCFILGSKNSVLKNFRYLLFCIKFPHEIQLFLKNCVLLRYTFKTAFSKAFTISGWEMHFPLNPLMEYNSFLKTVFCYIVGSKPRFAKFLPFLAKKCVLHQIY